MASAKEWIAFLNSSEADSLATQGPSEGLRQQFALDYHMVKLDNLCEIVHGLNRRNQPPEF